MKHSSKLVARAAILSVTTLAATGLQQTLVAAEETSLDNTSEAVLVQDSSSTPEASSKVNEKATAPSSEVKETSTEASEEKTTEPTPATRSEEAQPEAVTASDATEAETTDNTNTLTPSQVEQERKNTTLRFTDTAVQTKATIQELPYLTAEEKKQYQAEIDQNLQEDLDKLSKSSIKLFIFNNGSLKRWMLNGDFTNFSSGSELWSIYSSEKAKTYYEEEVASFETRAIETIQKDTTLTEEQKELYISALMASVKRKDFGFGTSFSDPFYKEPRQKFLTHLEKLGAPIAFYLPGYHSPIYTGDILAIYSDESLAKISEEYTKIINDSVDEAIKIGRETLNLSDDQVAILEKEKKTAVFKRDRSQPVTYHRSANEILNSFINSTQDINTKIKFNELRVKSAIKDDTVLSDEQKTLALSNLDKLVELATIMAKDGQNSYYIYENFFGGYLGKGVLAGGYDDIFNRAINYALINQDISTIIPSSSFSDSETGVSVDGASYKLDKVDKIEVTAVTNGVFNGKTYNAYDIKLLDKDANHIQPGGDIEVSLPITREDVEAVYYVNDKNELEALPFTVKAGQVIFVTNHFSVYAVVFKETADDDKNDNKVVPSKGQDDNEVAPNKGQDDNEVAPDKGQDDNKVAPNKGQDDNEVTPDKGQDDNEVTPNKGQEDSKVAPNKGQDDSEVAPDKGQDDNEVAPDKGQDDNEVAPDKGANKTAEQTGEPKASHTLPQDSSATGTQEIAATKDKETKTKAATAASNDQKQLPKTGDATSQLSLAGLLLSGLAFFGFKRKRN